MDAAEAVKTFAQSEKIKAGIIWTTQALNLLPGMSEPEKKGAVGAIRMVIGMIGQEVHLAGRATGNTTWMNTEKNIDMAMVMIDSGVAQEAVFHLSRALRQVANKAQQAMTFLSDNGLI